MGAQFVTAAVVGVITGNHDPTIECFLFIYLKILYEINWPFYLIGFQEVEFRLTFSLLINLLSLLPKMYFSYWNI